MILLNILIVSIEQVKEYFLLSLTKSIDTYHKAISFLYYNPTRIILMIF